MTDELRKNATRWAIFATVAVVVVVSLLIGGVSDFKATPVVMKVYDTIEKMPAGTPLLISADFDPGSEAELEPMLRAILAQCWRKKLRVVVMSICSVNSPPLAGRILKESAAAHGAVYGTDFVQFGYRAGGSAPILALGQDWFAVYPKDLNDTPSRELPVMKGITKLTDFPLCLEISAVSTIDYWILAGNAKYGLKLALGVTAVMATDYYQYLATGQVVGIIGGIAGASQYESLTRRDDLKRASESGKDGGLASSRMPTQSAIHVAVVLLILIGNILYFMGRRKAKA
ncbi:MAG: hypothetical protein FD180_2699 [Planctomycetota bacterium]|nr:MAG: hypothetical protein FD180_2699 [Planctomycetota bacterium]